MPSIDMGLIRVWIQPVVSVVSILLVTGIAIGYQRSEIGRIKEAAEQASIQAAQVNELGPRVEMALRAVSRLEGKVEAGAASNEKDRQLLARIETRLDESTINIRRDIQRLENSLLHFGP